ncbi:CoF synthetase [Algibacter sp. L4_22]|uniref:CoF synthetase n=1 Tax=Algibacter sp. L4_22 TaxID=2942477 RepID=UPI00201B793A|nr:CoF synthetase [Algibacter sp. L4_22]MCL5129735.1 CoF synthetase [Algibacter sp. L4_22]
MNILNKLRNVAFWTIDSMKGGGVKKDFKDLEQIFSNSSFSSLQKHQEPILDKLLQMAVYNSDYYSSYKNFKSLKDFPVVNKLIIKDNFNKMTFYDEDKAFIPVKTSGSTGAPFKIYQTKRKKIRNTADTLYFAKLAGFTLGEKLLYLRLWAAYYKKSKIISWFQNTEQLDVSDLNDNYTKTLLDRLQKDKFVKGWIGYPSGFEVICNYLDRVNAKPLECNIKSIIAIAEGLSPEIKSKMEYYFKTTTVSRYSNVENGIIAQQMPDDDCFRINWGSYIVEILDLEKDIPVKDGEIGRIIVTDLYNLATPMIRYDTGDIGAFENNTNTPNSIPKLKSIQGRKMDALYKTNGDMLNPFTMHAYVYDFPEIKQLQFIQHEEKKYEIKVNTDVKFVNEAALTDKFRNDIGKDALIEISYVNEIPSLKSGKRKISINLCKK